MAREKVNMSRLDNSLAFYSSDLFHDVQMSGLFKDSKMFADAEAKFPWTEIYAKYKYASTASDFDLNAFVQSHFEMPAQDSKVAAIESSSVREQIQLLWSKLEKPADVAKNDSLLPLSLPYLVPGGRFREIYYWDSYFTALGLIESNRADLVLCMLQNFIELQKQVGCIPNGNRSYYITRSQPPILGLMVELLLAQNAFIEDKPDFLVQCVAAMENEYAFWMSDVDLLTAQHPSSKRVVRMDNGCILNRYWDSSPLPRAESYREDIEAAINLPYEQRADYYRNIRAACESGWDFSARWLDDPNDLLTIKTTQILPVDLNSLMYKLEVLLSQYCEILGRIEDAQRYKSLSQQRKETINQYLWNEPQGCYLDFDIQRNKPSAVVSLATCVPLFVKLADDNQAGKIAKCIQQDFLHTGGLTTTLCSSAQQWDSPNGWAPLHWFTSQGLLNYGYQILAREVIQNWLHTVEHQFALHGNLMEKYNVLSTDEIAQGGEYEVQHGFGWTNGVTLAYYHYLDGILSNGR